MRREAIAILSSGALVAHSKYRNLTYLDPTGVDLSRANVGEIPLLCVHDPERKVGHISSAWRSSGLLKGRLRFDRTPEGRDAFERLESGEVRGVSVGTRSHAITVVDGFGREHAFDEREWEQYHQDPASILHVKRWQLCEVSLTENPADRGAFARPISQEAKRIRRRMAEAQRELGGDDDDDAPFLIRMPGAIFRRVDGMVL